MRLIPYVLFALVTVGLVVGCTRLPSDGKVTNSVSTTPDSDKAGKGPVDTWKVIAQ